MSYQPCAGSPVSVLSVKDTTGLNKGNLTAAFTTGVLGTMPAVFEWFRANIDTETPGGTFTPAPCSIRLNQLKPVSSTYPIGVTEWDPSQPIPMRQGDELYFFWQIAASVTPAPLVTCWFRYDTSLPANQAYRG
jgi:hypothetical protein